jgi:hypothetical protein
VDLFCQQNMCPWQNNTYLLQGKRAFIKDMAQYWIPPSGKPATVAPSLSNYRRGVGTDTTSLSPVTTRADPSKPPYPYDTKGEPNNPTVVPADLLKTYHFTFLIRHPKFSIPSYYRCTIPPLDKMTGFYNFRSDEAGYDELRRLFDYLRSEGQIGPKYAGRKSEQDHNAEVNGHSGGVEICVIDADDLLDNPSRVVEAFCKTTGIEWDPEMLKWDTEKDQAVAKEAFEKWKGFHEDALDSDRLRARTHVRSVSDSSLSAS